MSLPKEKEVNLVTLVNAFIEGDPLLKKHVTYEHEDLVYNGALLGACFPKDKVQYAIGSVLIRDDDTAAPAVYVWRWKPFKTNKSGAQKHFSRGHSEHVLFPGDPQFFEKLKIELFRAHDSLSDYHGCEKLWNTSAARPATKAKKAKRVPHAF